MKIQNAEPNLPAQDRNIWHEIVNDSIENDAVAVTYCPLCGTAMVFDRNIDGKARTFGVSGLLYRSDVLMYDRETESLWSQLGMKILEYALFTYFKAGVTCSKSYLDIINS